MKNFSLCGTPIRGEVLELLSPEPGKTEILAGGTDLVGLMKKMVVTPDRVVNIMQVDSMMQIEAVAGRRRGDRRHGHARRRARQSATWQIIAASPMPSWASTACSCRHRARSAVSSASGHSAGRFRNGHGLLPDPDDGSDTQFEAIFDNLDGLDSSALRGWPRADRLGGECARDWSGRRSRAVGAARRSSTARRARSRSGRPCCRPIRSSHTSSYRRLRGV